MLSIGQLADYVGVTRRAIRHYHALGLLAEPRRDASGYRSYDADALVDLRRIKVLADAGVPLARVRELTDAGPAALRDAVNAIDADLRDRIRALERARGSLAALAAAEEPFLPPRVASMHARMRSLGASARTLDTERDAWVLVQVLFPDLVDAWVETQARMLDDPGYVELYLLQDQAFDWPPDDPRIEQVARGTVEWMVHNGPSPDPAGWDDDGTAYDLIANFRRNASPGWRRLIERTEELAIEAGLGC